MIDNKIKIIAVVIVFLLFAIFVFISFNFTPKKLEGTQYQKNSFTIKARSVQPIYLMSNLYYHQDDCPNMLNREVSVYGDVWVSRGNDIGFSVKDENNKILYYMPRITNQKQYIDISLPTDKFYLVFDNSYSIFTSKEISYDLQIKYSCTC